MRRREFLALLGVVAGGLPFSARAQKPGRSYRIAMVHPNRATEEMTEGGPNQAYRAFFQELRRLGYVEGENLIVERYSGGGRAATYAELAASIVRSNPDLIYVGGGLQSYFREATSKIPIVTFMSADDARSGLVASLARPGGNITGVGTDAGTENWGKRLELLQQVVPAMSRIGFLVVRPDSVSAVAIRELVRKAGLTIVEPSFDPSKKETEYKRAFAVMSEQGAAAVIVVPEGENVANLEVIVAQAAEVRLPAIYSHREPVDIGGLMAYAIDFVELLRVMARQIDQILKGKNPGEIPIYLPTKFDLIINLKTAKSLGLTLPSGLLANANEVIE
jgi:putative ABC transport system substrate-binding protein